MFGLACRRQGGVWVKEGGSMGNYSGFLYLGGDDESAVKVEVDLTGERLSVQAGDVEVGDWDLSEIRINALGDGFHVRAEGEEVVLQIDQDGEFAVDLGLRTAPPNLRKKISALMRNDAKPGTPA